MVMMEVIIVWKKIEHAAEISEGNNDNYKLPGPSKSGGKEWRIERGDVSRK